MIGVNDKNSHFQNALEVLNSHEDCQELAVVLRVLVLIIPIISSKINPRGQAVRLLLIEYRTDGHVSGIGREDQRLVRLEKGRGCCACYATFAAFEAASESGV